MLYKHIPEHKFIFKDFTFQESDKLIITHIGSAYYFEVYVSHETVGPAGVTGSLFGVTYIPLRHGFIIKPEQVVKREKLDSWGAVISLFDDWLSFLQQEFELPERFNQPDDEYAEPSSSHALTAPLSSLHPTIQQAAGSLFATGHYRQALLDAFIAVDNAVQAKSQLTGSGTRLMEVAFSPGNPVLKIGDSADEQQGFMALFRGAMLAIRNPKAHSLDGTHDAQRALEWLSFASVLLRNLDDAVLAQPPATPPAP